MRSHILRLCKSEVTCRGYARVRSHMPRHADWPLLVSDMWLQPGRKISTGRKISSTGRKAQAEGTSRTGRNSGACRQSD